MKKFPPKLDPLDQDTKGADRALENRVEWDHFDAKEALRAQEERARRERERLSLELKEEERKRRAKNVS